MPVRLELSSADVEDIRVLDNGHEVRVGDPRELRGIVSEIMGKLGDTIVDRELVVKVARPGLPRISLVDLPGIREFPESMSAASKRVTEKYVRDPNTIVLCVVPAGKAPNVRLCRSLVVVFYGFPSIHPCSLLACRPTRLSESFPRFVRATAHSSS